MSLVPMKQILDEAMKGGYGVGAFNVNNMEQIQAIMEAARRTASPVIIQASRGALKYSNLIYLKHLMLAAVEENPDVPVAMHLDHGNGLEVIKQAIGLGFTSVMIDGSLMEDGKTPSAYEYNVDITKKVVDYAHRFGVTVEGELGTLGGIEDGVGSGQIHLTDPTQAAAFIKATGVDALAIAIGTSHGAYKFKAAPALAIHLVEDIHRRCPSIPLVMHGSSSVPRDLVDTINRYGGNMPNAMGVPMESIQAAIRKGVRKVNVDTDSRLAVTGAVRKVLVETPEKFDPRDYLKPAREAMMTVVEGKMKDFGQAGHAGDYKPLSLENMKKIYEH
ncbi:MAG: fructose-bisphosphate aldolase class II [Deltaproteobacteria bacterium]|nr:fructose-bisphosphate aldolase class II [Deltaproteobacteria bacterium]